MAPSVETEPQENWIGKKFFRTHCYQILEIVARAKADIKKIASFGRMAKRRLREQGLSLHLNLKDGVLTTRGSDSRECTKIYGTLKS